MNLKSFLIYFVLTLSCLSQLTRAQSNTIDSLLKLIGTDNADTTQIKHYLKICVEFQKIGEFDKALTYVNKSIALSRSIKVDNGTGWIKGLSSAYLQKGLIYEYTNNNQEALKNYLEALRLRRLAGDKFGVSNAYNQIGTVHLNLGNYSEALASYFSSLELRRETNNNQAIADSYNNIGNVYYYLADYPEALKFYLASLKIGEKIKDTKLLSSSYINTGNIYYFLKDYNKALNSFNTALKYSEQLNELYNIALCYNNIGETYTALGNYPKALTNYFISQKMANEIEARQLVAASHINIGKIYQKQNKSIEALENYSSALEINRKIEDKYSLAHGLINLSSLKITFNKTDEARAHLLEALGLSNEIGSRELTKNCYYSLAQLDSMNGNWNGAYLNYQLYTTYKDSIDNEENRKKAIKSTLARDFEKRADEVKAAQDKKDAIATENRKKQQIVLLLVSCLLTLALLSAFFIFRSLKLTRKQKRIIESKNKDIIDSINYAKRIQDALLKSEEHRQNNLPEYFTLYKPKDIVSGDFYWSIEKQDYWYLAVADCTGHGVPGAFMSMLGVAFLNEITADSHLFTPAEILEQLRSKIVKELGQGGQENETKDGMDISLIRLDLKTKELQWAGANTPLYFIQQERINVIKADKQPIGYHLSMKPFTNHILKPETTSTFYLFTDGYADQFGGSKAKKFMNKNLKDLMLSIHSKPMQEQKQLFASNFDSWKGNLEQVDDVCIIGVRI